MAAARPGGPGAEPRPGGARGRAAPDCGGAGGVGTTGDRGEKLGPGGGPKNGELIMKK